MQTQKCVYVILAKLCGPVRNVTNVGKKTPQTSEALCRTILNYHKERKKGSKDFLSAALIEERGFGLLPKELFPIVFFPATFRKTGPQFNPTLITKNVHKDTSLCINISDINKLEEIKYWLTTKVKSYVTPFLYTEEKKCTGKKNPAKS